MPAPFRVRRLVLYYTKLWALGKRAQCLTCGWFVTKLHHLAQTHAGRWKIGIMPDGVHQSL